MPAIGVLAEDQDQGLATTLRAQFLQRQDRVGRTRPAEFTIVDQESGIIPDRSAQHREARRGIGQWRRAVRRVARRHECDGFEAEQLVELMGRAQVPEVDRVEHPAEQAEWAQARDRFSRGSLRAASGRPRWRRRARSAWSRRRRPPCLPGP